MRSLFYLPTSHNNTIEASPTIVQMYIHIALLQLGENCRKTAIRVALFRAVPLRAARARAAPFRCRFYRCPLSRYQHPPTHNEPPHNCPTPPRIPSPVLRTHPLYIPFPVRRIVPQKNTLLGVIASH